MFNVCYCMMLDVKMIAGITLCVLVIVVAVTLLVYTLRHKEDTTVKEFLLPFVKAIVTALIVLAGAGAAGTLLTGCVAKRSITVQGTVVQSTGSADSTRIIISSQETYTGRKHGQ